MLFLHVMLHLLLLLSNDLWVAGFYSEHTGTSFGRDIDACCPRGEKICQVGKAQPLKDMDKYGCV